MAWLRGEVTRHRDYKVAGFSPGRGNKGTSLLKACFGQQLKKKKKKLKPQTEGLCAFESFSSFNEFFSQSIHSPEMHGACLHY